LLASAWRQDAPVAASKMTGIFEAAEQIQQVVSRATSRLRIE
jgi:hypothetical protein